MIKQRVNWDSAVNRCFSPSFWARWGFNFSISNMYIYFNIFIILLHTKSVLLSTRQLSLYSIKIAYKDACGNCWWDSPINLCFFMWWMLKSNQGCSSTYLCKRYSAERNQISSPKIFSSILLNAAYYLDTCVCQRSTKLSVEYTESEIDLF